MRSGLTRQSPGQPDFDALTAIFHDPVVDALVLMGSHARGDADRFSDVDLVRFCSDSDDSSGAKTYLIDGFFVVVSDVRPAQVEEWFGKPDLASATMSGLRSARPLWDPEGVFAAVQERALAFTWDAEMQARADAWASSQMVGWIEEVQKGLAGLRTGHEGRLLNARFGLTWGMTNIMPVHLGILISGDNGTYPETIQELGANSRWAKLSRRAFGLDGADSVTGQVRAGLQLYVHTAELLHGILRPDDKGLVAEAVRRIRFEISGESGPQTGY